ISDGALVAIKVLQGERSGSALQRRLPMSGDACRGRGWHVQCIPDAVMRRGAAITLDPPANEDEDPLLVLSRELDKVNASLALAHRKHEALRKRRGTRAPPPTKLPRAVARPDLGGGGYRSKDGRAEFHRALDDAKKVRALLRAENSKLESECD